MYLNLMKQRDKMMEIYERVNILGHVEKKNKQKTKTLT